MAPNRVRTMVFSLFLYVFLALPAEAQLWNKVIETQYGPVQGYKYFNDSTFDEFFNGSNTITAFLGIPFAASTAYENRWKAPQPRTPWNTTLNATSFGAACPSAGVAGYSEDCLNLNIWTSATSANASMPVLLWNQGSDETSNNAMWYGGGVANKDVVFVSFNRRDDAFGYLALPELNAEGFQLTGHNTSGNYGILDQLAVLHWIRDNIANFGGDPEKVTIAGQSFGSSQTYHAVNSGLFSGLFRAAISESGIRDTRDPALAGLATSYVTMDTALAFGANYTRFHNVSTLAELRQLPVEDLLIGSQDRVTNTTIWWVEALTVMYPLIFKPVLDGYVLPMTYTQQLAYGPANDVPVITGNALDESGASTTTNYTVDEYKYYCSLKYNGLASEYFKLYPGNNDTQVDSSWNQAATDQSVVGSWNFANGWYKSAKSPFYTYLWDHAPPNQTQGAYHQSEIMYALNALYAATERYTWTSQDYYIADVMSTYWTNFAKTMNPNLGSNNSSGTTPSNLTTWAPNVPGLRTVMQLGNGFGPMPIATDAHTNFTLKFYSLQTPY